jgi:ATP-dependent helicase/DNAse subunit B
VSQDPLLGDESRARLAEAGVRLATTTERQREEQFLFDLAISRATSLTVLSYPKYDAKGDENLRRSSWKVIGDNDAGGPVSVPVPSLPCSRAHAGDL